MFMFSMSCMISLYILLLLTAIMFIYTPLLLAMFICFHILSVSWAVLFPFHARSYKLKGYHKYVHLTMLLLALILPWSAIIVAFDRGVFLHARFETWLRVFKIQQIFASFKVRHYIKVTSIYYVLDWTQCVSVSFNSIRCYIVKYLLYSLFTWQLKLYINILCDKIISCSCSQLLCSSTPFCCSLCLPAFIFCQCFGQ